MSEPRIERFFDSMPNISKVEVYNHEDGCGFYVTWAEKGTGFGTFTIGIRKATGEVVVDTAPRRPNPFTGYNTGL